MYMSFASWFVDDSSEFSVTGSHFGTSGVTVAFDFSISPKNFVSGV
jgi:hypothetical protein